MATASVAVDRLADFIFLLLLFNITWRFKRIFDIAAWRLVSVARA